jgi:hypothetical protein
MFFQCLYVQVGQFLFWLCGGVNGIRQQKQHIAAAGNLEAVAQG